MTCYLCLLSVLRLILAFLEAFLESLSTMEWIQAILTIMKNCNDDVKTMEKLSLLLQRLSKIGSVDFYACLDFIINDQKRSLFNAQLVFNLNLCVNAS